MFGIINCIISWKTTVMSQHAQLFETEKILFDIFYKELMEQQKKSEGQQDTVPLFLWP